MNRRIELRVNGATVTAEVEPRTQLADFLRDGLLLTGTHLGCEHGVCGACTIEIDGAPARSCITYAVACEGADVRTIEGFDADSLMADLREAFAAEHALQCGYCTPGMLVTARDIVLRLPDADEARVRKELAGNLCRCTGYVGIVRAIQSVLVKRGGTIGASESPAGGERAQVEHQIDMAMMPAKSNSIPVSAEPAPASGTERIAATSNQRTAAVGSSQADGKHVIGGAAHPTTLHQSFTVDYARAVVWDFFGQLGAVTQCLPGTSVIGTSTPDEVQAQIRIRVGPITADFKGTAAVAVRDASSYSGVIHGSARDARSSSATRGEIRYVLAEESSSATRVDVDVAYTLTGTLAQFSRSAIAQDIAKRMTAAFAQNLHARLRQLEGGVADHHATPQRVSELDAGSVLISVLWSRVKRFFRTLIRR